MNQLTLSQAIEGYLLEKQAQHLSPHTVADYTNAFRKLQAYLGTDVSFAGITAAQIKGFLGDLSTPRAPNGVAKRPAKGLSNKTILNIHTALSALWTWAVAEGIVTQHLLRQIPRPRPEKRAITPFSEEDIKTLLANGERSRTYTRPGKRACDHAVATALRNRTIILLLLDTGIRASELCGLAIKDADLTNKRILVLGKGTLCEELRAADLPAHGQDAVALPDHRAQGRAGQRAAVSGQRGRPVEPGRAAQAADPAGGQGRRAGLSPAPVPPHVRGEFPAQRWERIRTPDSVPRFSGHGAGAHHTADGADLPGAGAGGPGRGAPEGVAGGELEAIERCDSLGRNIKKR
jgi:integrase